MPTHHYGRTSAAAVMMPDVASNVLLRADARQVAVKHPRGVEVPADDIAARIDRECRRAGRARNIDRGELTVAQHEAVARWTGAARARIAVLADDVAAGVDAAVVRGRRLAVGQERRRELTVAELEQTDPAPRL